MKKLALCFMFLLVAGTAFATEATEAKEVARAVFATAIEEREPVEVITEYVPVAEGRVFFFTELRNMQDTQIAHVWHNNGEEIYTFTSNISGARWRTNSSMRAEHFKAGDKVTVEVMDNTGAVLESVTLNIR